MDDTSKGTTFNSIWSIISQKTSFVVSKATKTYSAYIPKDRPTKIFIRLKV